MICYAFTCRSCNGIGYYSTEINCNKSASDCCGGCFTNEECHDCEGLGQINVDVSSDAICCILDSIESGQYKVAKELLNEIIYEVQQEKN